MLYTLLQAADLIEISLLAAACVCLAYLGRHYLCLVAPSEPSTKAELKRVAGQWRPVEFDYPTINVADCIQDAPKYRPFRYGPDYHVTMGIRSMPWSEWIQLDQEYERYMTIRERRHIDKASDLIITLPEAREAALECVLELAAFLVKRYPRVYSCLPAHSQHSRGGQDIRSVTCKVRSKTWYLQQPASCKVDDPMTVCGLLIQDDSFVMMERADGHYYLCAAASLTPGFWRAKDKIGMCLRDLHISSDVPYFESKLMKSMERFFSKLDVEKPVQRNNYFFQLDDVLDWNEKMMGDEAHFLHQTHSPHPESIAKGLVDWMPPTPIINPEDLHLRSERQTLRRMPRTGCIFFTVRTYITPLVILATEPKVPGRFASAIRSWDKTVAEYKSKQLFAPVVLPYLDRVHAEQIASGLIRPHTFISFLRRPSATLVRPVPLCMHHASSLIGRRVAFFGSDDFSRLICEQLSDCLRCLFAIDDGLNTTFVDVRLIVTPVAAFRGRGHHKLSQLPLQNYAASHSIRNTLYTSTGEVLEALHHVKPDFLIVASFGRLIPAEIIDAVPSLHALNVHPSLLPQWRGPAPIQWSIANRDKQTGVTIQELSKGVFDHGRIMAQHAMEMPDKATSIHLSRTLASASVVLLKQIMHAPETFKANAKLQAGRVTHARKIKQIDSKINWADSDALRLEAWHRGISIHYPLWTTLNEQQILLLDVDVASLSMNTFQSALRPGQAILDSLSGTVLVGCASGHLRVRKIQTTGRKPVDANQWWKGKARGASSIQFS